MLEAHAKNLWFRETWGHEMKASWDYCDIGWATMADMDVSTNA